MEKVPLRTIGRSRNVISILLVLMVALALLAVGCAPAQEAPGEPAEREVDAARWSMSSGPPYAGKCRAVAVADFNLDKLPDVAASRVSHPMTSVLFWYGDGRGNWVTGAPITIPGDVRSMAAGDINEDGFADLVLAVHGGSGGVRILINKGDGSWGNGKPPTSAGSFQSVKLADINHDGSLDVAAARSSSNEEGGVLVFLGDGKGDWIKEVGPTAAHLYNDLSVADMNRDGHPDIVASGWGTYGALRLWLGTGTGRWHAAPDQPRENLWGIDTGDVDRDGNLDVAVCFARKGIRLFLGDGKGGFKDRHAVVDIGDFWDVVLADLDKNGLLDIVASSFANNGIKVWYNTGGLDWDEENDSLPATATYYGVEVADVNLDGRLDILAGHNSEGLNVFLQGISRPKPAIAEELEKIGASIAGAKSQEDAIAALAEPPKNSVFTQEMGFPEYRVGPSDELKVTVWHGVEEKSYDVLVRADGKISFLYFDNLDVDDLTPTQIDTLITDRLKEYVMRPRVEVQVTKFRSKTASLFGEIRSVGGRPDTGPGTYPLTGKIRLLEFITTHGGPSPHADLSRVELVRGENRYNIDLEKTLFKGDKSQNLVLDESDVVILPRITERGNRVFVFGEVKKPGIFKYKDNLSILDAVSKAGGFTLYAVSTDTKVIRGDPTHPEVISSNMRQLIKEGDLSQNINLANNDIVYVPRDKIGDVASFLTKIAPILQFVLYPALVRDAYVEDERGLQFSVGGGSNP